MPHTLGVYDRFGGFLTWVLLYEPSSWVLQLFIEPIFEWSLRFPWLLARRLYCNTGSCLFRQRLVLNIASMLEVLFGNENFDV